VTTTPGKPAPKTGKPAQTAPKKMEESGDEESSEEENPTTKTKPAPNGNKKKEDAESGSDESSEIIKKDNPTGSLKRKRNEVDNTVNKKRRVDENGGGTGEGTKIRLGNLSFELDGQVDEIKNQFTDCGEIVNVEMIQRNDGRWAGVVIIEFSSEDAAKKAIEMHDQEFWGRKMSISYPKERGGGAGGKGGFKKDFTEKPEGCNTVFIGNLNYNISEDEVKEFFSQCGDITDVRWPKGEFKGFGWVEFTTTEAPDKAIELAGNDLMGRSIRIDYAAPRKERNF